MALRGLGGVRRGRLAGWQVATNFKSSLSSFHFDDDEEWNGTGGVFFFFLAFFPRSLFADDAALSLLAGWEMGSLHSPPLPFFALFVRVE